MTLPERLRKHAERLAGWPLPLVDVIDDMVHAASEIEKLEVAVDRAEVRERKDKEVTDDIN